MLISSQYVKGFAMGVGVAALGFYLYKKNQKQVDEFLRKQGINVPCSSGSDLSTLSLEELISEKERIEDIIAERETVTVQPQEVPAQ